MALDPEDIQARLDAFDRSAKGYTHPYHQELERVLEGAERIYRWLVYGEETVNRLIILAGTPYEQGDPTPEEEGVQQVALTLTDTQQIDLSVEPVDSKGNATDDSSLTWSVDNEDAISIVGADDGDPKTVTLVAGNPGVATVTVTDANGVTGAEAVTVTAGATASFNVTAGDPVEQPAAPTTPVTPDPPVTPVTPDPPVTAISLFSFIGADPSTIDPSVWPLADVVDANGAPLYTFTGDPSTIDSTLWTPYSGATSPVSSTDSPTP